MNLYSVLTISVLVVLFLVIVFWFFVKKQKVRSSLTAVIDIDPSGKSNVEFSPPLEITDERLIKLALLYFVKIRFLVASEPDEVFNAFKEIFGQIEEQVNENGFSSIRASIAEFAEIFRNPDGGSAATNNGERFIVSLIDESSVNHVETKLPFPPGLAANLPISVVFLIEEVFSRIQSDDSENNNRYEALINWLSGSLFVRKEMNLGDMTSFNHVITESFRTTEGLPFVLDD